MIKTKHFSINQILLISVLTLFSLFFGPAYGRASADTTTRAGCEEAGGTWEEYQTRQGGVPDGIAFRCDNIPSDEVIEDNGEVDVNVNGKDENGNDIVLEGEHYCGKGDNQVRISFDIGCLGNDYQCPTSGEVDFNGISLEKTCEYNPVIDMLFALLRFISAGVGIVVVGSIVWAGIQYSASRGNPQSTEAALKRVANAVIALLIYIFAFAILNFVVPGGLFL